MTGDKRVAEVLKASAAYRAADRVLSGLEGAWRGSRVGAALRGAPADRIRFRATAAATAAATALILAPFDTAPRPLAWLVPAAAGVVSLLVLLSTLRAGVDRPTR